ncbi:hypothetical protein MBLNU230_g4367t1 [Neophaeotheca triangularis]
MSNLSPLGAELAALPSFRNMLESVTADAYSESNPNGFVNLGAAENFLMLDTMSGFVNQHLSTTANDFSYGSGPWGSAKLRALMAKHINKRFHPVEEVHASNLIFANGVTSLCEMLGFVIATPGDGILLSRPIYQAFQIDFGTKARVKCVYASFQGTDQFAPSAAQHYERTLEEAEAHGTRIRALLLCHPHNPLGQSYPRETIIEVMKLCERRKIHLFMDEIYALSVYKVASEPTATPFTSSLAFPSGDYISPERLHLLYGLSKDFAAGGLRLGCLYTRNAELMAAMSACTQFHWSGAGNERIAEAVLGDDEFLDGFFATSAERLGERNALVRSLLDDKGIGYHRGANAGFFLWVDLRPYLGVTGKEDKEAEEVLMQRFMDNKLALTPGLSMSAEEPGWFRIVFTRSEEEMRLAMQRLFRACGI